MLVQYKVEYLDGWEDEIKFSMVSKKYTDGKNILKKDLLPFSIFYGPDVDTKFSKLFDILYYLKLYALSGDLSELSNIPIPTKNKFLKITLDTTVFSYEIKFGVENKFNEVLYFKEDGVEVKCLPEKIPLFEKPNKYHHSILNVVRNWFRKLEFDSYRSEFEKDKIYFINNFGEGLHPITCHNKTRKILENLKELNSQVIVSTNQTFLLKNLPKEDLISEDQIWFFGETNYIDQEISLYSLLEFKDLDRFKKDYESPYLFGRFGGIPLGGVYV